MREKLTQGIASLTSPYIDATQPRPTVDCYLGGIILRVVGVFGDLVHRMNDSCVTLPSLPVVSLQINPNSDFLCHCDDSHFELALWHALQCPFSDEDVPIVWPSICFLANSAELRFHFTKTAPLTFS